MQYISSFIENQSCSDRVMVEKRTFTVCEKANSLMACCFLVNVSCVEKFKVVLSVSIQTCSVMCL